MIRRIVLFTTIAVLLFLISFFAHKYINQINEVFLTFSLLNVYVFNIIAALVIYILIEATAAYLPSNAGYAYLASVFIKMGFFLLIFQKNIFGEIPLTKPERLSLVIPLFFYLFLEAFFAGKLLNTK